MSEQSQGSRFILARAGIGLAATVVETAVELPGRAIKAGLHLPANVLGAGARGYLQLTHTLNELAVRGDAVLSTVFPPHEAQPAWVTFDEDEEPGEVADEGYPDGVEELLDDAAYDFADGDIDADA